mgnify:CR=1 FL=1
MSDYLYEQPVVKLNETEKKAIVNRLKRIEGQVRGIQKMVEDDRYCIDILVQISAIQAALKKVGLSITERHMKHCVAHAVETGDGERAIEELIDVMKQFAK